MRHWLTDILDFIMPPTCHVCDARLAPHERFACSHCLSTLPRSGYHRRKMNPMEERFAGQFPFERATGHFFYSRDSALSTLIQDMKYRHFPGIGEMLGRIVAQELFPTGFFLDIDVILPVPMHFLKQARRGYNQTHHIAAGISNETGIPVSYALKAIHSHPTQTSMSQQERLDNTRGIFSISPSHNLDGKGILLIDDVCTTGATLISAAHAIHSSVKSPHLTILSLGVTF